MTRAEPSAPSMLDAVVHPAEFPTVDLALAQRLERAEAMANAASVDARRALQPAVGAEWIDVAGTYAMFDGTDSPLTQTFGLGLAEPCGVRELERLEAFFSQRGASTSHEVCTFATPAVLRLISERGYTPIEASVVLIRPTSTTTAAAPGAITVRAITVEEAPLWCRVAGEGWGSESAELAAFVESFGVIVTRARGVTCFLAELDGAPVAAAALNVNNGVALLAGATTIPAARRQGAQRALLQARLAFAAARAIPLAMVVTQPGSASQRNAERQGFRPVYTRAKWLRATDATRVS
jgi:GNAT superfamily N-acetyltransferase